MATVSNRYDVKAALVEALTGHPNLAGVEVSVGWPGKHIEREHVWLARTTGVVTYPHAMAGRKTRQDEFTITVMFMAAQKGQTVDEGQARVQAMYQALDDLGADGETIGTLDGVVWSLHGEQVEGPDTEETDEGSAAFMRVDVTVEARYL